VEKYFSLAQRKNWTVRPSGTTNRLKLDPVHQSKNGHRGWRCGTIIRSNTGGVTWTTLPLEAKEDLFSVDFVTPELGWIVGARGNHPAH